MMSIARPLLPRPAQRALLSVLLLVTAWLAGCATGPNAHPHDPMEPWNRGVYKFNDAVDKAVVKPVATAYTKVTPGFLQTGVRNFFGNLGDAWSTVNSLLQFKGQDTMNSFWRVAINTTFGLGGIFDVASEARIPQNKQDFGLTLGHWGIASGPYMVLPLMGPSSLRDTVALPVDMKGNPLGAVRHAATRNSLVAGSVINQRAQLLEAGDLLDQAALDPYAFMRDAYLQSRDAKVRAGKNPAATVPANTPAGAAAEGYEPPPEASGAAAAMPQGNEAPSRSAADTEGYEPPPQESSPSAVPMPARPPASAPAAPQAAPYYVPAVPQLLDRVNSGWGSNLWRR